MIVSHLTPCSPPTHPHAFGRRCSIPPRLAFFQGSPTRKDAQGAARQRAAHRHLPARIRAAAYEPYQWDESNFYTAALQLVQGTLEGSAQGFLLVMRVNASSGALEDEERGLVLAVGGDTLRSISMLTQSTPVERPLALDLLWQVLGRGREISKRDWQLLWVAIVELRGSVFIGRLFFGDPGTGRVVWDCDTRPSDSIWLALKAKCPIYVHKRVWEENASALRDLRGDSPDVVQAPEGGREEPQQRRQYRGNVDPGRGSRTAQPAPAPAGDGEEGDTPAALMTRIRPTDPEPLKRLKMEMKVALKEEDYATAARIRDHPFMRMHLRIMEHAKAGRESEASDLEARLHDAVERYERSGGTELQEFEE